MKKIKLTKEQTRYLTHGDGVDKFCFIESGEWVSKGKYEYCDIVITDGEKFYRFDVSRTGSCYSEWYYSYEDEGADAFEVEKKEVTITKWVAVK